MPTHDRADLRFSSLGEAPPRVAHSL